MCVASASIDLQWLVEIFEHLPYKICTYIYNIFIPYYVILYYVTLLYISINVAVIVDFHYSANKI